MTQRKRGFMRIAKQIIYEQPGLTRDEVAERALQRDPSLSNARNPVHSLGATLAKQVRMGMEADIEARDERPTRYYPKATPNTPNGNKSAGSPMTIIFQVGNSYFRGPATKENLQRIKQWLNEIENEGEVR